MQEELGTEELPTTFSKNEGDIKSDILSMGKTRNQPRLSFVITCLSWKRISFFWTEFAAMLNSHQEWQ